MLEERHLKLKLGLREIDRFGEEHWQVTDTWRPIMVRFIIWVSGSSMNEVVAVLGTLCD